MDACFEVEFNILFDSHLQTVVYTSDFSNVRCKHLHLHYIETMMCTRGIHFFETLHQG